MFQFPHLPHPPSKGGVPAHHGGGLPHSEISGSACQRLPGAFRSVTTSFFGPGCQGIHHMPLFACDTPPSAPLLHSLCPSRNAARYRIAEESVHEHLLTHIVVVTHLTLDRCRCVSSCAKLVPNCSYFCRPQGRHAEAFACYSLLGILLVMCCSSGSRPL
jgi:hypothetical protein